VQYQKKHSPTHTHEEEEGFTQTTRSALSQRGLLDPIKPAYNQSQLDGWLKLTDSAFNWQSWSQYLLLCRTRCILYQLPPLLLATFWILRVQEKITEADACTPPHLEWTIGAPTIIPPFFTPNALSAATLPIYPGSGQAPNNDGLHTQWLGA